MSQKSEIRNGMRIDWDVPIAMDDGVVLRADVYRPIGEGRFSMTTPATGLRRSSAERSLSMPAAGRAPMRCCPLFRDDK
jgi:predicted acyl esterase